MIEIVLWAAVWGFIVGMLVATTFLMNAYKQRYEMYWEIRNHLRRVEQELRMTKTLLEDCRDE